MSSINQFLKKRDQVLNGKQPLQSVNKQESLVNSDDTLCDLGMVLDGIVSNVTSWTLTQDYLAQQTQKTPKAL